MVQVENPSAIVKNVESFFKKKKKKGLILPVTVVNSRYLYLFPQTIVFPNKKQILTFDYYLYAGPNTKNNPSAIAGSATNINTQKEKESD